MLKLFKKKIADLLVIAERLFKQKMNFSALQMVVGFIIGVGAMFLVASVAPEKVIILKSPPEVRVVEKLVEKPVIVKEPVYISANDKRQIQCLAENAYFEAGNQSTKGMIAVTNVVMNRAKDERFPSTACAVVHQKASGVCQFSWVCEGKKKIRDWALFEKTKKIAEHVYIGNYGDVTHGAKFYHANYVSPGWRNMTHVATIGDHIFYRG